jgi:hypothetical protein
MLNPNFTSVVPEVLLSQPNWVNWKYFERGGKKTKAPCQSNAERTAFAKSNDPSTWSEFEDAFAVAPDYDGIGFMLHGSEFTGIDFDGVVKNGMVDTYVLGIIDVLGNPYAEITPSGEGVRVFVKGTELPKGGRKFTKDNPKFGAEIYSGAEGGRYLTITGNKLPGTRSEVPALTKDRLELAHVLMSQILDDKFKALWTNDQNYIAEHYGGDQSRADAALAAMLVPLFKRDAQKIENAFSASALGERDKWTGRQDYRERTIKNALNLPPMPATVTLGGTSLGGAQVSGTAEASLVDPSQWPSQFRAVEELEDGDIRMIIESFLPEGTTFIGGLAGVGKTFFVLSIVKALTTGRPFVDTFGVNEQLPVLYLVPESSGRAFRSRLKRFGIPNDRSKFLCRTLSEGATLMLDDPHVLQCVRDIRPIVVLDTAIRFSQAKDENAAAQNKALVDSIVALRQAGAAGVIGIHHAVKASAGEKPSLENTLRGTGDLGAMCDAVYNVTQFELDGEVKLKITCVKERDFQAPFPFHLIAKKKVNGLIVSTIDTTGDFELVEFGQEVDERNAALAKAIIENPHIPREALAVRIRVGKNTVVSLAQKLGWEKKNNRAP